MTESTIISKIWNMANVLRDDGVSYGDYLEQITYLLFLKMADEMNKPPYNKGLKFLHLKDAEGKEIPECQSLMRLQLTLSKTWNNTIFHIAFSIR